MARWRILDETGEYVDVEKWRARRQAQLEKALGRARGEKAATRVDVQKAVKATIGQLTPSDRAALARGVERDRVRKSGHTPREHLEGLLVRDDGDGRVAAVEVSLDGCGARRLRGHEASENAFARGRGRRVSTRDILEQPTSYPDGSRRDERRR